MESAEILRRVEAERAARGVSWRGLARAAGRTKADILYRIVAGEGAQVEAGARVRLARGLGQPWDWLGPEPPAGVQGRGAQLWAARMARGWSLRELARQAQMSEATLVKLEHGAAGYRSTWAHLAQVLGAEL